MIEGYKDKDNYFTERNCALAISLMQIDDLSPTHISLGDLDLKVLPPILIMSLYEFANKRIAVRKIHNKDVLWSCSLLDKIRIEKLRRSYS